MAALHSTAARWFGTGEANFTAGLEAIAAARRSVEFEFYIVNPCPLADRFLEALTAAARRGVRVRALVDAFGSISLPDSFWAPLRAVGGEARWFNPLALRRFNIRNHRKLLVCDRERAFIGGFNVSSEWEGDGVARGWRDVGAELQGRVVAALGESFEEMWGRAEFRHKRFIRLRRRAGSGGRSGADAGLFLSAPGRGKNAFKLALRQELAHARELRIVCAYFLPPPGLRRAIARVARRGGLVQLILPGRSDIPLLPEATRSLYQRLFRAGVEVYEYQPQVLHSKLILVDGSVYVGSSNLDARSLNINYELMVRLTSPAAMAGARAIFDEDLARSVRILPGAWRKSRSLWNKLKERAAYFFFARVDPYIARRQWRGLR